MVSDLVHSTVTTVDILEELQSISSSTLLNTLEHVLDTVSALPICSKDTAIGLFHH